MLIHETCIMKSKRSQIVFRKSSLGNPALILSDLRAQESEQYLHELIFSAHYGLAILRGKNWVIEIANKLMADLWDKDLNEIIGLPLMTVLPELKDQPYPALLTEVYETGMAYSQEEEILHLDTVNGRKIKFVWFNYDPMFDKDGKVCAIIISAADTTEKVENRRLLEKSMHHQASLIEELGEANTQLSISEAKFRVMVQQAPVAIAILRGKDHIIEEANYIILERWGKLEDVINLPLIVALPEHSGQAFIAILDEVYRTGIPYTGHEEKVIYIIEGKPQVFYLNFIYQPLDDEKGVTTAIMIVATDVTKQVESGKELQKLTEISRLSVDAANIGIWSQDLKTGEVKFSARHKELFGFNADEETLALALMEQIPLVQRIQVVDAMQGSINNGGLYDITFSALGFHDHKTRWIRALGSVIRDDKQIPTYFSGITIETTRQMEDELRKNNFISIVSHELKTPLTSLKGYIQLVQKILEGSDDAILSAILQKADLRLDKMTSLINGFLNVTQLDSGKIQLNMNVFGMEELIIEITDEINLQERGRSIRYTSEGLTFVHADREKIGQVLSNLLNNSAKYSAPGSYITVCCETKNGIVSISVKDQGIGISKEDQRRIFDRYYRAESPQNKLISGFGIGLYLCNEILKGHHGELSVESILGKGSTFFFTLPVVQYKQAVREII